MSTRRMFLRGLGGITVGLPVFSYMLNDHGDAFAGGEAIPTRFGLWFFGNGVHMGQFTPSVGPDWQPPEGGALTSLVPVKEYVSVVTGMSVTTPRHAHHSGMSAVCSGGPHLKVADVRDTIVSTMRYPSVDQVAAEYFATTSAVPTPYRSLEAAITRFRGTDEGTSFQYLSHNGSVAGESNINPSEESPHAFWDRLFNQGTVEPLLRKARASVLDSVGGQIGDLEGKLGAKDKQRLDQHLTSIRELEARLSAPLADCTPPGDPGEYPDLESNEQVAEKNVAMSDLVVLALACGLTRSFSIQYSTCGSGAVFWMVGATDGHHYLNHTEAAPWNVGAAVAKFNMEQLAYFLTKMRDTTEGAGNLLEHSSILCCTEHSEGWTHSQDDMPMLVCGKGGGRLRGNVHYRGAGDTTTRTLLTALR
ncbi:MAG: DUF1552 domain-containing protein, partial [Deltaproteobacteria bacterium]|nr:DUF1552 domain-containing protein [Nannocystaceae bacterium]